MPRQFNSKRPKSTSGAESKTDLAELLSTWVCKPREQFITQWLNDDFEQEAKILNDQADDDVRAMQNLITEYFSTWGRIKRWLTALKNLGQPEERIPNILE